MTTSQVSTSVSSSDLVAGFMGVTALGSLVLTDFARRWTPNQSIAISSIPLLIASLGALGWLLSPWRVSLPRYFAAAIASLLAMCLWGSIVAALNDLPPAQIAAGWLAEAGAVPGLLLGFAVATNDDAWSKFWKAAVAIIYFSTAIALLQQLGLLQTDAFEMLEGSQTRRGLSTGGYFQYTSGPFRTANIFSGFLAAMGLVAAMRFGDQLEQRKPYRQRLLTSNVVLLVALLICSLLAARRSGLFMLLAAVVPLLILMPGRLTKFLTVITAVSAMASLMGSNEGETTDFRHKLEFATSETDFAGRFSEGTTVGDADWDLLSWTGDGIGSHGPATQAGGRLAFERDKYLLERHVIIHVGWFKSLLGYGPVGAVLQLTWFIGLLLGLKALCDRASASGLASRYCGPTFALILTINHYFVATSWLQSVSGGLVLGMALGTCSGRLYAAALQAEVYGQSAPA